MPESTLERSSEDYYGDAPISLSHMTHVLRRYAGVIVISLASVALAYLIVATATYLFSARQKVVSLPFRLEFKGASEGNYPNGLKFSVADIVATPVLIDVYNADAVGRFVSFDRFSKAIFVLESNRELERLTAEYETKLADTKLTPVDRDRIEREFESKRASINKSEYALQYAPATEQAIPTTVINKALGDILATWSRRAAVEKKVLDYQVAVISPSVIDRIQVTGDNYLIPLLLLRQRVNDAIANATAVEDVPGAKLVRLPAGRLSISDIRAHLDEILRFRIEPVVTAAYHGSSENAVAVVKSQLAYDERVLSEAQMRETALRNALLTYESEATSPQETAASAGASSRPATTTANPRSISGETVMPQLSDTFIDRIVDLTTKTGDREYRQRLTNEIKNASLAVIPAQAAVKYDQELLDLFQRGAGSATPPPAALKGQWDTAVADVRDTITNLNGIYTLASRQLYPETEMFRLTGPAVARVERTVSLQRLFLYGVLVLLIALPLIIVFVLLHNRVREEEAAEERENAAVQQRPATA
jgi:hypothetical protein